MCKFFQIFLVKILDPPGFSRHDLPIWDDASDVSKKIYTSQFWNLIENVRIFEENS